MASPHAVGVGRPLIVSEWGHPDGGKNVGSADDEAENLGSSSAGTTPDHASANPPTIDYTIVGERYVVCNATCTGTADFNSIWARASWTP